MPETIRGRVALIGMDAAELSFIRQHLDILPRLREVFASGSLHRLHSTAGALTGSVWPTFASGTPPGEHGIYHHLQWDAEGMRLRRVTADWLYYEPFWYELERGGFRVVAVDVPATFPSRLSRGIEIMNWGSHDQIGPFHAHPAGLGSELRRRFGDHPMGPEIPVRKTPAQMDRIRRNLVTGARRKGELLRWVLAQAEWDFFVGIFGETHRGGHLLWPSADDSRSHQPLLDVYRAVDESLGAVLDALPSDVGTVVVFALHGMGRNTSQEHFMPRLMDRINAGFMSEASTSGHKVGSGEQRGVIRLLRERMPAMVQNAVARAVPVSVRDEVLNRQISGGRDWSRTPAFALLADLHGYVRCNLRGRERDGMLESNGNRAESYLAWASSCLKGLRTEEGAPLVADVLLARERFPGRRSGALPDAIVTWSGIEPAFQVRSDALGEIAAELATGRGGNHRPNGFCAVIERGGADAPRGPAPNHIADFARFVSARLRHG
jgi:predicted AlkP superfamily phosphohydrolase/phosphomutase